MNVDDVALRISLCFLFSQMGHNVTCLLMEYMSNLQNDLSTTLYLTQFIAEWLELSESINIPASIENIIVQNVLMWLNSDYGKIRWNAARILLNMPQHDEYKDLINHQVIQLIDTQSASVKNLIIRNVERLGGLTDTTKEYVIKKCENDASFVVRTVSRENTRVSE